MPPRHSIHHLTAIDSKIRKLAEAPETGTTMPVLFIGHGGPMNAVDDSEYGRAWAAVAGRCPSPKPSCASRPTGRRMEPGSRRWSSQGPFFYGFPPELYKKRYPAPGSPELTRLTVETLKDSHVQADSEWGLDHGAWAVLCQMYRDRDCIFGGGTGRGVTLAGANASIAPEFKIWHDWRHP